MKSINIESAKDIKKLDAETLFKIYNWTRDEILMRLR